MTRIVVSVIDSCSPANCMFCKILKDPKSDSTYFFCRKTGRLIETWNFKGKEDRFPGFCPLQENGAEETAI